MANVISFYDKSIYLIYEVIWKQGNIDEIILSFSLQFLKFNTNLL